MTEHSARSTPARSAVDVPALERAASDLDDGSHQLQQMSRRLAQQAADAGDPRTDEDVLGLQGAALSALQALAGGLEESAAVLRLAAERYQGGEERITLSLRPCDHPR